MLDRRPKDTHTNTKYIIHTYRQFYLFPNLLLCSFGIDAAAETHMLRVPQVSLKKWRRWMVRRGPTRSFGFDVRPYFTSTNP